MKIVQANFGSSPGSNPFLFEGHSRSSPVSVPEGERGVTLCETKNFHVEVRNFFKMKIALAIIGSSRGVPHSRLTLHVHTKNFYGEMRNFFKTKIVLANFERPRGVDLRGTQHGCTKKFIGGVQKNFKMKIV